MLDQARGLGIAHLEKELGIQPRTYAAPEGKKSLFPAVDRILDDYAEARAFWVTGIAKEDILKGARSFIFQYAKEHPGVSEAGVGFEEGLYGSLKNWLPQVDAAGRTINQAARSEVVARTNIMDMYNHARAAMMTSAELAGWIQAFRYSAILDSTTTPLCRHLHGKIMTAETINGYNPPNHFNCRSVLLPVTQLDEGWQKEMDKQGPIKGDPQAGFSAPLGAPPEVPAGKHPIPGAPLEGAAAKEAAPEAAQKPKKEPPAEVMTPSVAELMPEWSLLPELLQAELAVLKADLTGSAGMIKASEIPKLTKALNTAAETWFKKNAGYVPETQPRGIRTTIVPGEVPFPEVEAAKAAKAAADAAAQAKLDAANKITPMTPKLMWDLAMQETGWTNAYEAQPSWLKQKINSWVQKLKQGGPKEFWQVESWAKDLASKLPGMIEKGPSVGQQEKAAMKGKPLEPDQQAVIDAKLKGVSFEPKPGEPGWEPAVTVLDIDALTWSEKGPQNTKFWPKKFDQHTPTAQAIIKAELEKAFPGLQKPPYMDATEFSTQLQAALGKAVGKAYPGKAGYELKLGYAPTITAEVAPVWTPKPEVGAKPAPPPPPAAAEPLGPVSGTIPVGSAANILKTKLGDAKGSNPGGTYKGEDGVTRYVKFYQDPAQAYSEAAANNVYAAMGLGAPKSIVFVHEGKLAIASEIVAGARTIKELGLGAVDAKTILKGFATDVLTANWDAVGTGFDNVMRLADGKIVRIDQGGSLLFRAKAGRKSANLLNDVTEIQGFADSGKNPYYSQVFQKAGINYASEIPGITQQLDKIQALRAKTNNFADLVPKVDGVPDADRTAILKMLRSRADLMNTNLRREIYEFEHPPPPPPPVEVTGRKPPTDPIIKKALEEFDRSIGNIDKRPVRTEPFEWHDVDAAIHAALTRAHGAKFATGFIEMRDKIWGNWKGSAVSEAAGMGKYLAEKAGLSAETTYHSQGFMDKDAARRSQFLRHYEELERKWSTKYGADVVARYAQLEYHLTQKLLKKAYPDGKIPTLYRGVSGDWFQENGIRPPQVTRGTWAECVVHQSSVSGFSTKPDLSFGGGWKFKTEPKAEELFTTYFFVKGAGGSYQGEHEWWFLSAGPQRFQVTRM